jgi:polysaccharide deacetylase 2 family uncharacterized protein YibQ
MQKKGKSSAAKKSAPRKRKARKAKVALDRKKLMVLCAAICASCVLLLAATAFLSRGNDGSKEASLPSVEKNFEAENLSPVNAEAETKKEKKSKKEKKREEKKSGDQKAAPAPTPAPKKEEPKPEPKPAPKEEAAPAPVAVPSPQPAAPQADGFGFVPAKNGAVLCVVFDDGGQNISQLKKCVALPFPVTVAVLPRLAHSAESARIVRQSKNEVILHQPMQAMNLNVNPGAGAIKPEMTENEVFATLSQNIAEISPIAGMNNHEGSLITENEVLVSFILQAASEKGIYFLDSRTSSATKVPSVAMEMGMGWYQRDIFLDNQKTRENYLAELKKGLDIANKKGHVIMIGHVWSAESLPAFLEEAYPELALKGYRFATVSKSGGMYR